jgi:group II intron reverse transcriptase/maturase
LSPANLSTKRQWIADLAREHPERVLTTLHHLIDLEWMNEAYRLTRKDGAPGIDGVTAADYEANLEANLQGLLTRIKSGRYVAPPVRRHYIPKADGTKRPLGIPTLEDKVAQRAILLLLEPIYEMDFLPCSYGFRPGRSAHDALHALRDGFMEQGLRWVVDVDISKYFDTIDHTHLRSFLDQRVKDGVVRRMIDKWLKAGVLEEGVLRRTTGGTPQGGVISPLLANIYLHHVLDEWFASVVTPRLKGRCRLVRYADDAVIAFEDHLSSKKMLDVLGKRLGRYGLALHPTKTRFVDFRFRRPGGRHPATVGTTFNFLGFTHVWGKSRNGKNVVRQITAKDRYARALASVTEWCRRNLHLPFREQHARLTRMIRGHCAYYGITGNGRRIRWYHHQLVRIWKKWLARRGRHSNLPWPRFKAMLARYPLPPALIVHQYNVA